MSLFSFSKRFRLQNLIPAQIKFGLKTKITLLFFASLLIIIFFFQTYYYHSRDFALTDNLVTYDSQEDPILKAKLLLNKDTKISLDIRGEIVKPGVYELPGGSNLDEAIKMAGGFTNNADKDFIDKNMNLASILSDRQKILVPAKTVIPTLTSAKENIPGTKININTATQAELELLDGIGPATAKKIINARPFKKIEDIKKVSGIGDAKFNAIKDEIIV